MEYLIVTFRSRSETLEFAEIFKKKGIFVEIVNTPKEAKVGCGLSAKIPKGYNTLVKSIVINNGLKSFVAVFLVKVYGGQRTVRPL